MERRALAVAVRRRHRVDSRSILQEHLRYVDPIHLDKLVQRAKTCYAAAQLQLSYSYATAQLQLRYSYATAQPQLSYS